MTGFRLLSTKILRPSQRRRFVDLGVDYIEHNFISIELLPFNEEIPNKPLIFTSQNAVHAVLNSLKKETYECYCVGEKTKQLLIENGQKVLKTTSNATDLGNFLANLAQKQSFLFFTGNERRPAIESALKRGPHTLEIREVYKSSPTSKALGNNQGILFFSPNGVKSYLQTNALNDQQTFAIGTTTANALEKYTSHIIIARQPSVEHLLVAVKKHLQLLC